MLEHNLSAAPAAFCAPLARKLISLEQGFFFASTSIKESVAVGLGQRRPDKWLNQTLK